MSEEVAILLKDEGNMCFREKRFHKSIRLYTDSLKIREDAIVLGNRAQAYISLKSYHEAVLDCTRAIELNPSFSKAYYRRAVALEALGYDDRALADATKCCEIVNDASTRSLLERIAKKGKKTVVEEIPEYTITQSDSSVVNAQNLKRDDNEIRSKTPASVSNTIYKEPSISDLTVPRSYLDFHCQFIMLKNWPLLLCKHFVKIPLSSYRKIFDELLTDEILICLLKGFRKGIELREFSPVDVSERLLALSDIKRFDMVTVFLCDEDRKNLEAICENLSSVQARHLRDRFII